MPWEITPEEAGEKAKTAQSWLRECYLCPRECRVNRFDGGKGFCKSGDKAVVSSFVPHFGEEPELVGTQGSGTIFFARCNLGCVFCQNHEISHLGRGSEVTAQELAGMMLSLQKRGCHNINFVTPTHFVPQILEAVRVAMEEGLNIPLVYNCGGYESVRTLKLLENVIDIYMPDIKYSDARASKTFSSAPDYFTAAKSAVREMHRQVGDLMIDRDGVAWRGLLVRHLVLPGGLAGTAAVMDFLSKEVSGGTYVNIMDQYRPCHEAADHPEISRHITQAEFSQAVRLAKEAGLFRGF